MCKAVQNAHAQSLMELLLARVDASVSYINFTVSRDRIDQDTINEAVKYQGKELKKPLKVKFEIEPAEDAGWYHFQSS